MNRNNMKRKPVFPVQPANCRTNGKYFEKYQKCCTKKKKYLKNNLEEKFN